ncbi:MAG: DUF5069 domain-containing protein [Verrucomicrobiae bacterium]|nr:DUF5069 domain-containing protein [Verrucomicrobiae bacterium]
MANSYPTIIPGLRSPFDQVNGLVYFGRMLDKIRLAAAGKLPPDWEAARGTITKLTRVLVARRFNSASGTFSKWKKTEFFCEGTFIRPKPRSGTTFSTIP